MTTEEYFDRQRIYQSCGIDQDSQVCVNCTHFRQHYIKSFVHRDDYTMIYFGHCAHKRVKNRHALDTCDYFASIKMPHQVVMTPDRAAESN